MSTVILVVICLSAGAIGGLVIAAICCAAGKGEK